MRQFDFGVYPSLFSTKNIHQNVISIESDKIDQEILTVKKLDETKLIIILHKSHFYRGLFSVALISSKV
jgi:hypothetical protein